MRSWPDLRGFGSSSGLCINGRLNSETSFRPFSFRPSACWPKRLAGADAKRVRGDEVFQVLDGYKRLILSHLGLSEAVRKPIRYSHFMGSDIAPALIPENWREIGSQVTPQLTDDPANRGRMKTNIFGQG